MTCSLPHAARRCPCARGDTPGIGAPRARRLLGSAAARRGCDRRPAAPSPIMTLSLHDRLRTAVRAALADRFGLDAAAIGVPLEIPPTAPWATSGRRWPSNWRARCARRPAPSPRTWPPALAPITGVQRVDAAANGYLNVFLDRAGVPARRTRRRAPAGGADAGRQDHRRAHRHQSQQGGPHRPPAQRRARRHPRARAALPRHARSKSRTTSTTPACRSPTSSSASVTSRAIDLEDVRAHRRHAPGSTTTAGTSTRASPSGTRRTSARLAIRAATLHEIEHGDDPAAAMGAVHRRAHRPLPPGDHGRGSNIDYDLLTWEGDILRMQFWATRLRAAAGDSGAVFLQTEGKLAGCWVMRIDDDAEPRRATAPSERRPKATSSARR